MRNPSKQNRVRKARRISDPDTEKKLVQFAKSSYKDREKALQRQIKVVEEHREKYKNNPDSKELDRLERELAQMKKIHEDEK